MRKTLIVPILLVLASCSSFESQRVRQAAFTIEEMAAQTTILNENERITVEQAKAVSASLKVALAEVERYWASVQSGAPRSVRSQILSIMNDALTEAAKILAAREAK